MYRSPWQNSSGQSYFYVLKGLVDALFKPIGIELSYQKTERLSSLHPYQQADVCLGDQVVGIIGQVHPRVAKAKDITKAFVFEISLDQVLEHQHQWTYQMVSKYPSIQRDIALLVDQDIESDVITKLIKQTGKPYLTDVMVFDVYQGTNIDASKKSVAYRLTFNNKDQTMASLDVDKVMKKIANRLQYELNITTR